MNHCIQIRTIFPSTQLRVATGPAIIAYKNCSFHPQSIYYLPSISPLYPLPLLILLITLPRPPKQQSPTMLPPPFNSVCYPSAINGHPQGMPLQFLIAYYFLRPLYRLFAKEMAPPHHFQIFHPSSRDSGSQRHMA